MQRNELDALLRVSVDLDTKYCMQPLQFLLNSSFVTDAQKTTDLSAIVVLIIW